VFSSFDITKGLDCITIIIEFLEEFGRDMTHTRNPNFTIPYKGKEYKVLGRDNPDDDLKNLRESKESHQITIEFVRKALTKTDKLKKGCVCILNSMKYKLVGIYVGDSRYLIMFEDCSRILKINDAVMEIYQ
jgi:hypothetical protein